MRYSKYIRYIYFVRVTRHTQLQVHMCIILYVTLMLLHVQDTTLNPGWKGLSYNSVRIF